jgi:enoyl-CoA hydratase
VLTSEGTSFFVAPTTSVSECDAAAEAWGDAIAAVARLEPPTVAVLEGDVVGAAWELGLACDLRVASTRARIGNPEIRWGRMPSAGGIQQLVRVSGPTLAMRLLLLGEVLSADEALALGLLHRVVAPTELRACSEALAAEIAAAAPVALAYTKEAARSSADLPLSDGLRLEADLASLLQTTSDRAEGIAAFLARRPPIYHGQ